MMLGICQREGKLRQTWSVMVVAFFAIFSQIGAMVLHISLEQIVQASCAWAQIEALGEGNRWLYLDDAGDLSEEELRQTWAVMVVAFFAIFSQIDVIKVVLIDYGWIGVGCKKKDVSFCLIFCNAFSSHLQRRTNTDSPIVKHNDLDDSNLRKKGKKGHHHHWSGLPRFSLSLMYPLHHPSITTYSSFQELNLRASAAF